MKCGMGNWSEVSSQFVKTKSELQCEEFYLGKIYMPGTAKISYQHVIKERDLSSFTKHTLVPEAIKECASKIGAYNEETRQFKE